MKTLLTKDEAENIAQLFGVRLIDWRRMSDDEAGAWMGETIYRLGGIDPFENIMRRTRDLSGKPRLLQMAGICSLAVPGIPNLVKEPPNWDDDELWRAVFNAIAYDELRKVADAARKRLIDEAMVEQLN